LAAKNGKIRGPLVAEKRQIRGRNYYSNRKEPYPSFIRETKTPFLLSVTSENGDKSKLLVSV